MEREADEYEEPAPGLAQTLRHINSLAKHHADRTEQELKELRTIRKTVLQPPGAAERNRKLLEKFRSEELRTEFVRLPVRTLRALARQKVLTREDAIDGMLAFLAALLTKFPLRISEAMALQFGVTIHDHGAKRKRQVLIDISAELVKNGMPRTAKFGPRLVELLDLYCEIIRPVLAHADNTFLFPNAGLGARSTDYISKQLAQWTSKVLVRMTAHQWRHVVGYIYLKQNPGCYEAVRRFLGHRSITTTMCYYAFMLEDDANESLDQTIDDLLDDNDSPTRRRR